VTIQKIIEFLADKINDEKNFPHEFHRGRVLAFEFAVDLLKEHLAEKAEGATK